MRRSSPIAPTITSPEFSPVRIAKRRPSWRRRSAAKPRSCARIKSAAWQARCAWSSWAIGAPNSAITPSPVYWLIVPSKRWIASASSAKKRSSTRCHPSAPARSESRTESITSTKSTVTGLRSPSSALRERRMRSARWLGVYARGCTMGVYSGETLTEATAMHVGIQLVLQNYLESTADGEVFELEYRLSELAEGLGFDSIWCVEHHFDWYSMGPDTPQILAYLAGRTRRIKLATGAVILPWNDPLRVVEKMILLDYQSQGRALFGMGHGLARMEYDGFGIDMNEARDRFVEAARMI